MNAHIPTPHLCPVRIGKPFGPAIETAILRKLELQGFSDGKPAPQLTALGITYIERCEQPSDKVISLRKAG